MGSEIGIGGGLIEAVNGSHLHWSEFRNNVLRSFRICSSTTPKADQLPTSFLARLQSLHGNLTKYDAQRQAWRVDVMSGRGLGPTSVFPPSLLPPVLGTSNILRCMSPRMSRESLPLRTPSEKHFLYELPTMKPSYVCGFDMEMFEKTEQPYLGGALTATGTVVDFGRAEVLPGKTLCCPFLVFEKYDANSEHHLETARNACAITGAQCLRAQQQLFHKAFGLQTASQPALAFTCALNNENAVINCHYVDDDGNYTMAPLCKFNLGADDHFNNFQAWIEAVESWASLHLLPRVKTALGEVMRSNPSPPPSPALTSTSHLSIDTNSDNVPAILKTLRRLWPMIPWHNDLIGETPINSSVAQCGTPLPTRQIRALSLQTPANNTSFGLSNVLNPIGPHSSISQRMADVLTPLQTEIPLSAHPQQHQSVHARRFSRSTGRSDGSTTPDSPCRPPSLSPCTPGPEAPVSSKSPMLVLQRRLENAISEIEELRAQIENLQGQINGRTETLERRLEILTERQEETEQLLDCNSTPRRTRGGWVRQLETLVEEDTPTPTVSAPRATIEEACEPGESPTCEMVPSSTSTAFVGMKMPGSFPPTSAEDAHLWEESCLTEELVVYCLALVLRDEKMSLIAMTLAGIVLCCSGLLDTGGVLACAAMMTASDYRVQRALMLVHTRLTILYKAAQVYDLQKSTGKVADSGIKNVNEVSEERTEEPTSSEEADVPLLLA